LEINDRYLQKDESIDVSYSILIVGQEERPDMFQKIATLLNVQLGTEGSVTLPFTPFINFDSAKHSDKLFLYGPSGCGKSRALFELVKQNLDKLNKIYFINPRNTVGNESGRIKILDLIAKLGELDGVVWDNFPDDLVRRDLENARNVLELISSKNVKRFLVALNPKYLEIYTDLHNRISEFHICEVAYSKEQIRNIIKSYGIEIALFRKLYQKYIEKDIDKISKILWQKEPAPLTILDYYKELTDRIQKVQGADVRQNTRPIDPLAEAEKLLRSNHYYEHQFALISNILQRQSDAEFLYTLKLCYESGLNRTTSYVLQLQKKVYDSIPSSEPLQKLSTWIYLSGQYYAMHDISREAIKFKDYARVKIMNYLTNDFIQVVPKSDSQIYLFGIFFGRNIEYIARDDPRTFLPDNIYRFMKSKRYFEIGIGEGSGEAILSLNEDLKEEICRRAETDIEFARGLAESVGRRFPLLDESSQEQILDMINSGDPFARFFGESLGAFLDQLSMESQNRIFELLEKDVAFTYGIGCGLGYKFTSLERNFQTKIVKKAERNSDLTRGLGVGFGRAFASLDKTSQDELFTRCETNHEFAMGLGMGFGSYFSYLQQDLRTAVFGKSDKNNQFAFGLGLYVGFFFTSLSKDLQTDIFKKVERNFLLARGLGFGLGYSFVYLPKEFQKELFAKVRNDVNLADGIGQGLGAVFKHLSREFKEQLYLLCNTNIGFAYGLGAGIGYCFKYIGHTLREEVFQRAEQDGAFAYGLGAGLGRTFGFSPTNVQNELLLRIEKNQEFAKGLGAGWGFNFVYHYDELQNLAFRKTQDNPQFAVGLGMGLGRTFQYLSSEIMENIYEKMKIDSQFAVGVGIYLGQVFTYLTNEVQENLFELVNINSEFAEGLGYGLGYVFSLHTKEFQDKILEKTEKNSKLMYGLGAGIGNNFEYLSTENKTQFFKSKNTTFAEGLGHGLGYSFKHLGKEVQEEIVNDLTFTEDSSYIHGVVVGLGNAYRYLPEYLQKELFARAEQNTKFAKALGEGLARSFIYFPKALQEQIYQRTEYDSNFANGVGRGIGYIFNYLSQAQRKQIMDRALSKDKANGLAVGFGAGLGRIFAYLSPEFRQELLMKADGNSHFAIGLGQGLGMIFPYLSRDLTRDILTRAHTQPDLSKSLSFSLGHTFASLKITFQQEMYDLAEKNADFAEGLGNGSGHVFESLNFTLQEQSLTFAGKNIKFAFGLGRGLGLVFNYLDLVLRQNILEWANKNDSFAEGFGDSLGNIFCSFDRSVQCELLRAVTKVEYKFLHSFGKSVFSNFNYLDTELQKQILSIKEITAISTPSSDTSSILSNTDSSRLGRDNNSHHHYSPFRYEDFPRVGFEAAIEDASSIFNIDTLNTSREEITFLGQRFNYCIGFIDMMNSTNIASSLIGTEISRYYSIFLNAMATIVNNFGGKIIKNAGDALLYYFPKSSDVNNEAGFKDVLECGITMIAAHGMINSKMQSESLPSINYRISADYGELHLAKSSSSQGEDLFGSAVNICAKINSKAPANQMVIGDDLYHIVKSLDDYDFTPVGEFSTKLKHNNNYPIYSVLSKHQENILNPFKRKSK
jgi:class 3 adenylate cyclase